MGPWWSRPRSPNDRWRPEVARPSRYGLGDGGLCPPPQTSSRPRPGDPPPTYNISQGVSTMSKEYTFKVVQRNIDIAVPGHSANCMIGLTLQDAGMWSILVTREVIRFNDGMTRRVFMCPAIVSKNLERFDEDKRLVKPFKFRLQDGTSAPVRIVGPPKVRVSLPGKRVSRPSGPIWCRTRRYLGSRVRKERV